MLEERQAKFLDDAAVTARPAVLDRLAILDTSEEQIYEDAAVLAAQICGTPMALIAFADGDRHWLKAKVGLAISELRAETGFCSLVMQDSAATVVENAVEDSRIATSKLVTGGLQIRFCAGVPVMADSIPVGTLCVLGPKPTSVSESQIDALEALGRQVSSILEQRLFAREMEAKNRELEAVAAKAEELGRKLVQSSKRFANLFEGLPVACIALDTNGNVMEWNAKSTEIYGYEPWEVVCKPIIDLVVPRHLQPLARKRFAENIRNGGRIESIEWNVMKKDGSPIWVLTSSVPLLDTDGKIVGLLSSNVDITDRKRAEAALVTSTMLIAKQKRALLKANAKLEKLSATDGLTGLYNLRAYEEFLRTAFACAQRSKGELSLILLDVDNFKSLNDEFGHPAGDEVLKQLAAVLANFSRKGGIVARYGGEEFAIVLPNAANASAMKAAERLRTAIESTAWPYKSITASFGVASYGEDVADAAALIQQADSALYESKSKGRNRVTLRGETGDARAA